MATTNNTTKLLLTGGVIAGPLYVGLAVLQMLIRPSFDPTRHDWSLLSNGDLGWIQITNFLVTGLLVLGAAIGLRRVLRGSKGGTWAPILLAVYGLGLLGAGIFTADPMNGFPLGAPAGAPVNPTASGLLHLVFGGFGFLGLISACFVLARRFRSLKQTAWARYSLVTGILFLIGFFAIAGSAQQQGAALQGITLAFTVAVLLAWSWVSAVSAYFKNPNVKG